MKKERNIYITIDKESGNITLKDFTEWLDRFLIMIIKKNNENA